MFHTLKMKNFYKINLKNEDKKVYNINHLPRPLPLPLYPPLPKFCIIPKKFMPSSSFFDLFFPGTFVRLRWTFIIRFLNVTPLKCKALSTPSSVSKDMYAQPLG